MKWLMDKNVPFVIDFESSTVDRVVVLDALPKRLQRALGHKIPIAGQPGSEDQPVEMAQDITILAEVGPNPEQATPGVPESADQANAVEAGTSEK